MSDLVRLSRRTALIGAAGAGGLMLAGCDRLSKSPSFVRVLATAGRLNMTTQRLLLSAGELAPEYTQADLSPWFKPNGSFTGTTDDYKRMLDDNFASYRLTVGGWRTSPPTVRR